MRKMINGTIVEVPEEGWAELRASLANQPEDIISGARRSRAKAYTQEADPLFFKWQAGEGTEADWLAKREEIRARYPYPE